MAPCLPAAGRLCAELGALATGAGASEEVLAKARIDGAFIVRPDEIPGEGREMPRIWLTRHM